MEVNFNGIRYYFRKNTDEPENLFYKKCWAFTKLNSSGLNYEEALKLSDLYSYKEYYNCDYSPEVEQKISQFFK